MTAKIIPYIKKELKCSFCKKEHTKDNPVIMVAKDDEGQPTGACACEACIKIFNELIKDET